MCYNTIVTLIPNVKRFGSAIEKKEKQTNSMEKEDGESEPVQC